MSCADSIEIFVPVPNYPGYGVSNLGRVRGCRGIGRGRKFRAKWSILKGYVNNNGYVMVDLYVKNQRTKKLVHRLVLEAFAGPCPEGKEARHVEENERSDNRLVNLKWGTRAENVEDKFRHGTQVMGEQCQAAKMTADQVREIRQRRARGEKVIDLAREFGIRVENASKICNGHHWKHV